ncbi:MAG: (deoxy)nucleoside triphosphate pyrophosphohydrolase [Ferruginibacter sp.]
MDFLTVVCAIIYIEGKILVTQRSEKMKLPLKWEFPGGKLEKDESESECIKREIKEELNIEIRIIKRLSSSIHKYKDFKIRLIPYAVEYESGEIILTEHARFQLIERHKLNSLDWAEADLPIVRELLNSEI